MFSVISVSWLKGSVSSLTKCQSNCCYNPNYQFWRYHQSSNVTELKKNVWKVQKLISAMLGLYRISGPFHFNLKFQADSNNTCLIQRFRNSITFITLIVIELYTRLTSDYSRFMELNLNLGSYLECYMWSYKNESYYSDWHQCLGENFTINKYLYNRRTLNKFHGTDPSLHVKLSKWNVLLWLTSVPGRKF